MRLEPVKSAEPPKNSGNALAIPSMAFWLALRVAMVSALSTVKAIKSWTVFVNPSGKSPEVLLRYSFAKSG